MLDAILRQFVLFLLRLRYRMRVQGLDDVAARGREGILFLPNHPALIDPIILMAVLNNSFHARALADASQVDRFFIRTLAARAGVRTIPDMDTSSVATGRHVQRQLAACMDDLRQGHCMLLYPAGRIKRSRLEKLGANSAVEAILRQMPDVRVVLVRTTGLWGSRFGWATGRAPSVAQVLRRGLWGLLASGVLFMPRRDVTIELAEPADLPRHADRNTINRFLEKFYNADAPPAMYVPLTPWERPGRRVMPEPASRDRAGEELAIPTTTRAAVLEFLADRAGVRSVREDARLAEDLGLDSLARVELATWLEKEFGVQPAPPEALVTVADVLLTAAGQATGAGQARVAAAPPAWFAVKRPDERVSVPLGRHVCTPATAANAAAVPPGETITQAFLSQARRLPSQVAVADQASGALTYRQLVRGCLALQPALRALPGERLGLLLPASAGADLAYLATLFAGKTPVMVNWTVGLEVVANWLDRLGVRRVLTSRVFIHRLRDQGQTLPGVEDRFVYLEDLRKSLTTGRKLAAAAAARTGRWSALEHADVPATAAILFTSGSEKLPKAVPLTHANLLANVRASLEAVDIRRRDAILGMLPPFHAFGLMVTTVLPLVAGARVVHWPNPLDAPGLAAVTETFRPTLLIGTPTFLGGVVRAAAPRQLDSLRLIVTGADRCPERLYERLAAACPGATVLEGYGVTECSPIVAVNRVEDHRPQTIGKPLPGFEIAIIPQGEDLAAIATAANAAAVPPTVQSPGNALPGLSAPSTAGLLLVRGPSVFGGYIGDAPSPFVQHDGRTWYNTGDIVRQDADGTLAFVGRVKRFVKLGGEMISLTAIEAALEAHYPPQEREGKPPAPTIAVTTTGEEGACEIVLFTTQALDRQHVNNLIRQAGLSPLHNIRRVVRVEEIPLLGTGKTNYWGLSAER